MSSPTRSWSDTTIAWASLNCSRYHGFIIIVSSGRPHMFSVYQRGRGHDPVTVAGSIRSFVAVNTYASGEWSRGRRRQRSRDHRAFGAACQTGAARALRALPAPRDSRNHGPGCDHGAVPEIRIVAVPYELGRLREGVGC